MTLSAYGKFETGTGSSISLIVQAEQFVSGKQED